MKKKCTIRRRDIHPSNQIIPQSLSGEFIHPANERQCGAKSLVYGIMQVEEKLPTTKLTSYIRGTKQDTITTARCYEMYCYEIIGSIQENPKK